MPSTSPPPHRPTDTGLDHSTHRLGQGVHVDRLRPHIFHRDYWTLKHIRAAVEQFLHAHGPELRGKKLLDYGSGVSPYAEIIAKYGIELLRTDMDPVDPAILPMSKDGVVPLPDASVAAIMSTQVLEHVPNPAAYLAEAYRLLSPGGLLLLSTHGAFILHPVPQDMRRWTIDGLKYEIEQAGFHVDSVEPRIGIMAMSTHLRSITYGGLTHRLPGTGWLRPLIYFFFNVRMAVEDWITPRSAMKAHPELLVAIARKPIS